jgi:hypothetical protein
VDNVDENIAATPVVPQPETSSPPPPRIVQPKPPPSPQGIPKPWMEPPQEPNRREPARKARIVSRSDKLVTRPFPNSTLMSGSIDAGRTVTIIEQFRDEVKIRDEDGNESWIPKDSLEPQE